MRVLWLSHFLPHRSTGHGALQRSHNLLVEAARRHEVHLISLADGEDASTADALRAAVESLQPKLASVHAFPIAPDAGRLRQLGAVASSAFSAPSYWDRRFLVPGMVEHVRSRGTTAFDLVHLDVVFLAPYLTHLPSVPVALNHHNVESDLLHRRSANSHWPGRWYFARQAAHVAGAEREWARRAGVNLVVSALDGERLRGLAGDVPVTVVPNGVDVDFFQPTPGVEAARSRLVFAGGMDWFPNREAMRYLATDLWPALRRGDPARRMTVVGRHPPAELLDAARRDPSLEVTGFVNDVRPYISAASIYLCPITVGGDTRLKILDALAMSRALGSTDLGVEGLDLVEGVHYLRANSTPEFVEQVRRLENDPVLVASLARAGRLFVEQRYAWPAIIDALDQGWALAAKR